MAFLSYGLALEFLTGQMENFIEVPQPFTTVESLYLANG
jgi:hypothetical protein